MKGCASLVVAILLCCEALGQHNDYKRCRCICPSTNFVHNNSKISRPHLFTASVLPSQCNCDSVVLPVVGPGVAARSGLLCQRCECKFESRNPALIRFVVIMLVALICFLLVYMAFLAWLRPLTLRKRHFYRDAPTEETQDLMKAEDPDD